MESEALVLCPFVSDTRWSASHVWPKLTLGTAAFGDIVCKHAASGGGDEADLIKRLFDLLDTDAFPSAEASTLQEAITLLRRNIYIPLIGDARH
jgi:hypothetical protein